ncbi:hypothetical protein [Massilia sp. 9096]|uniref:hypothetical protein n=1 Tax=Massilia sp. 9096 TaxID=1500894 RepID=UPI000A5A4E39|nr:hypothetical protein [Massilia sp. 9096]
MADTQDTTQATAKPETKKVKARVLVDCDLGKCNDVVEIDPKQVKAMAGTVDTDAEAVAYAESLAK